MKKFKPGVPKRWLFFAGATIWGFAAYRVLKLAFKFAPLAPWPEWETIVLGIIGFLLFFNFVFLKVSRRYIRRIACMKKQNPCIFAFFGWKSYLIIAFMSGMGIVFARFHLMPVFMQEIFYIALGGSLLMSAFLFLNAGLVYNGQIPDDCSEKPANQYK